MDPFDERTARAIREELDRILASDQFRLAPRQKAFLQYVVTESLEGRGGDLKETLIGTQVYGKPPDYDPQLDSTVRVEAGKLRQRLNHYYESHPRKSGIHVSIPKGGYHLLVEPDRHRPSHGGQSLWTAAATLCLFLAVILALGLTWLRMRQGREQSTPFVVKRLSEMGLYSAHPVLSPDGSFVVYSSDRDNNGILNLWRRPLNDMGQPARLTHSPYNQSEPALSSDGQLIVYRMEQDSGWLHALQLETNKGWVVRNTAGGRDPKVRPGKMQVAYWRPRDQETLDYGIVYLTSFEPKPERAPVLLFGNFAHAMNPVWSEDGRHLLILGTWESNVPEREYDAWVLRLDGDQPKAVPVKSGLMEALRAEGVYRGLRDRSGIKVTAWRRGWAYLNAGPPGSMELYRIRLLPEKARVEGSLVRLTAGAADAVDADAYRESLVTFARTQDSFNLASLPADPKSSEAGSPTFHTVEAGINIRAALDSTGNSLVWEHLPVHGSPEIWYLHLSDGRKVNLSGKPQRPSSHSLISPDGTAAVYRVIEPGIEPIYLRRLNGNNEEKLVCRNCGAPTDWSVDGRYIIYTTGGVPSRLGLLDLKTGKHGDWMHHPSYNLQGGRAQIDSSGNGWILFYVENSPGTRQVMLSRVSRWAPQDAGLWTAVTDGTHWDQSPAWGGVGNSPTVYFTNRHDGFRCILARDLDPTGKPKAGQPHAVHHFHSPGQSLSRSISNRGADGLRVIGSRVYFMLESSRSEIWLATDN